MIALVIVLLSILIVDYYKDNRVQSDIDVKFMSDYGNLTIGMLNRSIQTEEVAIHKYDTENTRYGFRLVELYPHNSYLKHNKFNDIIMLLDQASGCDAYYEIDMDKINDTDLTRFDVKKDFSDMKSNLDSLGYTCK